MAFFSKERSHIKLTTVGIYSLNISDSDAEPWLYTCSLCWVACIQSYDEGIPVSRIKVKNSAVLPRVKRVSSNSETEQEFSGDRTRSHQEGHAAGQRD
jgi:hypothetical protein